MNITKKVFATIVMLYSFLGTTYSQDYHKMLDHSEWLVSLYTQGGITHQISIFKQKDTIIGSNQYDVFIDSIIHSTFILREDTLEKRIYIYEDNQERLLFDFSLKVSDKITLSNGIEYIVQKIDSINVRNGVRKRFTLSESFQGNEYWIEGVGNDYHPFLDVSPASLAYRLMCSFQRGINVYNDGIARGDDTTYCESFYIPDTGNVSVEHILFENIKIYPNPFGNRIEIQDINENIDRVSIYSSIGQKILEYAPNQEYSIINTDDWACGIYFIAIELVNGKIIKNKFIKQTE